MAKSKQSDEEDAPAIVAAMMAINPVATKAWLDIMSEGTRFVTNRLEQDIETQKALLQCKTPSELIEVQSAFFKAALEQYSSEATRLFQMMSKAGEDTIKDAKKGRKSKYDDVPL